MELSQSHLDLCFALHGLKFGREDDAQVDESDETGHGDGDDAARFGGFELPAQMAIVYPWSADKRGAVHENEADGCGEEEWDTRGGHDDAVDSVTFGRDVVIFEARDHDDGNEPKRGEEELGTVSLGFFNLQMSRDRRMGGRRTTMSKSGKPEQIHTRQTSQLRLKLLHQSRFQIIIPIPIMEKGMEMRLRPMAVL